MGNDTRLPYRQPALQAIAVDRRDVEMYKLARGAIETLKKQSRQAGLNDQAGRFD